MSINPITDLSKVYLEQVSESHVPGKPSEKLGAVTAIPKDERDAARERTLAKAKAMREKKAKRWWDDDGDGVGYEKGEVSGKFVRKEAKETSKRWWDDDGDGVGYEKGEVSGKFKKKKIKEGFSNWREDLSEVMGGEKERGSRVQEKKVRNKIKVFPTLGEAVENIGGTLLEMVELDELDYILETVYNELLDEGYNEDDIEEALELALTEAKVTFGHDTPTTEKKKEHLSNTARKTIEGKYRGLGVGRVERVSSGSYVPPTKKKPTEKPADPWAGSETTPPKPKAKKRKASNVKAPAPKASAPKRKRKSKLDNLLADIRKEEVQIEALDKRFASMRSRGGRSAPPEERSVGGEMNRKNKDYWADTLGKNRDRGAGSKAARRVAALKKEETQLDEKTLTAAETKEKERLVKSMKDRAADFEKRYPGRGKEVMYATATKMAKKIAEQQLDELAPLVAGGLALGGAALAGMAIKKAQDAAKSGVDAAKSGAKVKPGQTGIAGAAYNMQRRNQQLQQLMNQSYEPEGEVIDERRKEDKVAGTPRKPRNPAFEIVAKSMGSSRMGVQPRGKKKEPGKKPPAAGEYGSGTFSPAQKVAKRRAAAERAQELMHSRFD